MLCYFCFISIFCAEKLLTSEGRELRRALFSLKQIFQDDKDLVHGFVALGGLNSLVRVGNNADQNYQNYILRALGQVTNYQNYAKENQNTAIQIDINNFILENKYACCSFELGDALRGWYERCNASQSNNTMALFVDRIEISISCENCAETVVSIRGICREQLLFVGECNSCGRCGSRCSTLVKYHEVSITCLNVDREK